MRNGRDNRDSTAPSRKSRVSQVVQGAWPFLCAVASLSAIALFLQPRGQRAERLATGSEAGFPRDEGSRASMTAQTQTAAFVGTVRTLDGKPIAQASVCATEALVHVALTQRSPCTVSDDTGHYELRGLAAGRYGLSASAEGRPSGTARGGSPILLRAGETQGVDLELGAQGVVLSGSVTDVLGGPVAQARVRVEQYRHRSRPTLEVVTDDDGKFRLWIDPGTWIVHAFADGYTTARSSVVAPKENVELVLTPGGTLRGQVIERDSQDPVAGVEVRAVLAGTNPMIAPSARSDEEGHFALSSLQPGVYTLVGTGPRERGESRRPIELELGGSVRDAILEVQRAVRIDGRVETDPAGEPCEQGTVFLGPPRRSEVSSSAQAAHVPAAVPYLFAPIDHEGNVHFEGAVRGTYAVTIQCLDHVLREGPQELEVARDDLGSITWRMAPGISLVVRMLDSQGAPVPNAPFSIYFPKPEGGPATLMGLNTDGQGRYESPKNFEPGSYTLVARPESSADPVSVELKRGQGQHEVVLKLRGASSIVVEVLGEDGEGVDGLRVVGLLPAGEKSESRVLRVAKGLPGVALGSGRYRIGPTLAGDYEVSIADGVNPPSAHNVTLLANQTQTLQVKLARSATLRGRVLDPQGAPAVSVPVVAAYDGHDGTSASRIQAGPALVLTDEQGQFELTRLSAEARFTVRAGHARGLHAQQDGVSPGTPIQLALVNGTPTKVESSP